MESAEKIYLERVLIRFSNWKKNIGFVQSALISLGLAILTGIVAQIRIPLPFSPVPITGQVFMVLLIGFVSGKYLGISSQLIYAGLGMWGLPWFSGLSGGFLTIAGPTGGYILGFIPAVYVVGWLSERREPKSFGLIFSIALAGLGIIYLFGLIQLSLFLNLGFRDAVRLGMVPFLWVDMIKILMVSLCIRKINPYE